MALYRVHYAVPVVAIVDDETEEVRRVVVINESISPPVRVTHENDATQPPGSVAHNVRAIADQADWPGWTFGF